MFDSCGGRKEVLHGSRKAWKAWNGEPWHTDLRSRRVTSQSLSCACRQPMHSIFMSEKTRGRVLHCSFAYIHDVLRCCWRTVQFVLMGCSMAFRWWKQDLERREQNVRTGDGFVKFRELNRHVRSPLWYGVWDMVLAGRTQRWSLSRSGTGSH